MSQQLSSLCRKRNSGDYLLHVEWYYYFVIVTAEGEDNVIPVAMMLSKQGGVEVMA